MLVFHEVSEMWVNGGGFWKCCCWWWLWWCWVVKGGGGEKREDGFCELIMIDDEDGFVVAAESLALSSANASQNALWVMKLSFLEKRVPQSHLYSLVPQVLE